MTHDCAQQGHVWLEGTRPVPASLPDGGVEAVSLVPYRRHRGRKEGSLVSCYCQHCDLTAELPAHGAFTAPPGPHPVDHQIPAPFKAVLDRAVAAAPKDTGPAREP